MTLNDLLELRWNNPHTLQVRVREDDESLVIDVEGIGFYNAMHESLPKLAQYLEEESDRADRLSQALLWLIGESILQYRRDNPGLEDVAYERYFQEQIDRLKLKPGDLSGRKTWTF
jgi:hypothetical protein